MIERPNLSSYEEVLTPIFNELRSLYNVSWSKKKMTSEEKKLLKENREHQRINLYATHSDRLRSRNISPAERSDTLRLLAAYACKIPLKPLDSVSQKKLLVELLGDYNTEKFPNCSKHARQALYQIIVTLFRNPNLSWDKREDLLKEYESIAMKEVFEHRSCNHNEKYALKNRGRLPEKYRTIPVDDLLIHVNEFAERRGRGFNYKDDCNACELLQNTLASMPTNSSNMFILRF